MRRLLKSFRHALLGIGFTFKHEKNFQIECGAALAVALCCLWLPLSGVEKAILVLAVTLVLGMELANTALEKVTDILKPRVHPYARVIKDAMAGAVLIASVGAALVGMLIILPFFIR